MSISYGRHETYTLDTCDVSTSVYEYRPSLAANAIFLALFGTALVIHIVQGLKWRTWAFLFAMFWGGVAEMIGYGGRIMLWKNPFSYPGFLTQISEYKPRPIALSFTKRADGRQSASRSPRPSSPQPST